MQMYTATVEVDERAPITPTDESDLVDAVRQILRTSGMSPRGFRSATVSVPAPSMAEACSLATAMVSALYDGAPVIACEVMTETEFMNRES